VIRFTLRQLEYFVAAAQQGGTAQAARVLNVSQPSVSQAITALESLWGTRLFLRVHARGLQLTTEGRHRYALALALLGQASELAYGQDAEPGGELTIGCLTTLGPLYVPGLLQKVQQAFPAITLRLQEGDTETLLEQVERDTLQLALIYDTGIFNRVQMHPVAQQRPYVLLPANHPLSTRENLQVGDLTDEPFVLINLPRSREYFLSIFSHAKVQPRIVAETGSVEMVRSLVANGFGLSILVTRPAVDVSYDGKPIACLPLFGDVPPQEIVMVSARHRPLGRIGSIVLDQAREYFASLKQGI